MNRIAAYLLGPELAWIVMLAITGLIISVSQPLPANDHDKLLNFGWFLPIIGVLLAFAPLLWAPGNQWWWLVRIVLASLIGVGLVVNFLCEAARYNDSRDSGIGTAFILFTGLGWLVMAGLVVVVGLALLVKWPYPIVYKWIVLVIGTFILLGSLLGWLSSLETTKTS